MLKQLSKNAGAAGCGEAFWQSAYMHFIIGEIDKAGCVSYFLQFLSIGIKIPQQIPLLSYHIREKLSRKISKYIQNFCIAF